MRTKQIIVFRKDLLKGEHSIRKGKFAAQVAHASIGALLQYFRKQNCIDQFGNTSTRYEVEFGDNSVLHDWLGGIFTKIVVGVDSEQELMEITQKCEDAEIPCALITDIGNTEFHGVPTVTCLGIGPYFSEKIDEITGNLQLL